MPGIDSIHFRLPDVSDSNQHLAGFFNKHTHKYVHTGARMHTHTHAYAGYESHWESAVGIYCVLFLRCLIIPCVCESEGEVVCACVRVRARELIHCLTLFS